MQARGENFTAIELGDETVNDSAWNDFSAIRITPQPGFHVVGDECFYLDNAATSPIPDNLNNWLHLKLSPGRYCALAPIGTPASSGRTRTVRFARNTLPSLISAIARTSCEPQRRMRQEASAPA